MKIFDEIESEVRSYARSFPRLFNRAKNEFLYDDDGNEYLDFLAGAGTLNYGHNNDNLVSTVLDVLVCVLVMCVKVHRVVCMLRT